MRSFFYDTAAEQGWTTTTQVNVLLDLIEQNLPAKVAQQYLQSRTKEESSCSGNDGVTIPVIAAFANTDDHVIVTEFDAKPWFEQASDDDIIKVAAADFSAGNDTDQIALFSENKPGFEGVWRLFNYLSNSPISISGDTVGYSCRIDPTDAFAWIVANRPHIFEQTVAAAHEDLDYIRAKLAAR